ESRARDLAFQAYALMERDPAARRDALAWLIAVLEVGHAVIDLRRELGQLPSDARYAATMPWRRSIARSAKTLTALFARPAAARLDAALAANVDAIAATQQALAAFAPPREDRHRLQRILSYLHFVRTALIDPQSPLAQDALASGRDDVAQA
ncbi:MAG: FUSC family protein, partial [Burkholderiales bacterium]|nr:FUSC family protein [Burkholderiales bacterium]